MRADALPFAAMRFAAIDVECATSDFGNICEIGLVVFHGAEEVGQFRSRVRPFIEEFGDWQRWNLPYSLRDLLKAPKFQAVWEEVGTMIGGLPVVAHNAGTVECRHFAAAFKAADIPASAMPEMFCSLELARKLWPDFPKHGLKQLAKEFKWSLDHHNPVSDARLSGWVVTEAVKMTGESTVANAFAKHKLRGCKVDIERAPNLRAKRDKLRKQLPSRHGQRRQGGMPELVTWTPTTSVPPVLDAGQQYVLSGFSNDRKAELHDLAKQCGLRKMSMVTPKTDFLVADELMGPAKFNRCKKYRVPILSEAEFLARLNALV